MYEQLFESVSYIKIKRGPSRPLPLDHILQQRMNTFMATQLTKINNRTRGQNNNGSNDSN